MARTAGPSFASFSSMTSSPEFSRECVAAAAVPAEDDKEYGTLDGGEAMAAAPLKGRRHEAPAVPTPRIQYG